MTTKLASLSHAALASDQLSSVHGGQDYQFGPWVISLPDISGSTQSATAINITDGNGNGVAHKDQSIFSWFI